MLLMWEICNKQWASAQNLQEYSWRHIPTDYVVHTSKKIEKNYIARSNRSDQNKKLYHTSLVCEFTQTIAK